jgi:hypothetical protein
VGGKQNFLIVSNSGDFQVVFNGAEPIVRNKWFNALRELGRVGVLKGLQSGSWRLLTILAIVVVARSKLLQDS